LLKSATDSNRWNFALAHDHDRMEDTFVAVTYSNPIYGALPNAIRLAAGCVRVGRLMRGRLGTSLGQSVDLLW